MKLLLAILKAAMHGTLGISDARNTTLISGSCPREGLGHGQKH